MKAKYYVKVMHLLVSGLFLHAAFTGCKSGSGNQDTQNNDINSRKDTFVFIRPAMEAILTDEGISGFDVISVDGKYIYQSNDGEKNFGISRYRMEGQSLKLDTFCEISSLLEGAIYKIILAKDAYSSGFMAICIPYTFEQDTRHWVVTDYDLVDVIFYSKDLKVLKRNHVKNTHWAFMMDWLENIKAPPFPYTYFVHSDTVSLMLNDWSS